MRNVLAIAARVVAVGLLLTSTITAKTDDFEPFGLPTVPASTGVFTVIWRNLQVQTQFDMKIISRCRALGARCLSPEAKKLISIIDDGANSDGIARIAHINLAVNAALRPSNDNSSVAWLSPLAVLARGRGDCKHYAVVKYAALSEIGINLDDLRIVITEKIGQRENHALVAVRNDGRWLILDNLTSVLTESSQVIDRYRPMYLLDHNGVRQYGNRVATNVTTCHS